MANPTRKVNPRDTDEVFSDLDINMAKNPVTGNLAKVTDEDAVKASYRNIILTMQGEWPHYRLLGSRVRRALFQPVGQIAANIIHRSIIEAAAFEPRGRLEYVTVTPMQNESGYDVIIAFRTVNSTTLHLFSTVLKRIR